MFSRKQKGDCGSGERCLVAKTAPRNDSWRVFAGQTPPGTAAEHLADGG